MPPQGNPELHMQDGFVRVDSAGTGFLMVRRDVLETMAEYYTYVGRIVCRQMHTHIGILAMAAIPLSSSGCTDPVRAVPPALLCGQ
jgi:hypothetical protein